MNGKSHYLPGNGGTSDVLNIPERYAVWIPFWKNYGVKRSSGVVAETDSQHYYPQMPYLLPNIQSDDITTEVKSDTF